MNEKEWTSKLRERMADYEEAAPEGLWERIDTALLEEQKKKARVVPLRKWWAAAAVTLALVAGGGYLYKNAHDGMQEMEKVTAEVETPAISTPSVNEEVITPVEQSATAVSSKVKNDQLLFAKNETKHQTVPQIVTTEGFNEASITEFYEEEADSKVVQSVVIPEEQRTDEEMLMEPEERYARVSSVPKRSSTNRKTLESMSPSRQSSFSTHSSRFTHLSAKLYAQNMMGGDDLRRDPVLMNPVTAANYAGVYEMSNKLGTRSPIYLYNYEEITKHHQPVTFGLSLSYPITSRLSVLSGITYTKLSTDFIQKMNTTQLVNEQQLHYVGLPLRMSYQIFSWKGFSLYGIAGGAADMNVKATYTTEGVKGKGKKDRMQFSADAAAGVQYQVLPQMGLYVEPGVKYYFDNKGAVNTFFKDHPANFNLQVGVRYELSK
ncbi:MAG: outer membrane beta-barrel protein [Prevotella sp.]|nr:outer membrane beta-barrel protein [Prevotella sp.]